MSANAKNFIKMCQHDHNDLGYLDKKTKTSPSSHNLLLTRTTFLAHTVDMHWETVKKFAQLV